MFWPLTDQDVAHIRITKVDFCLDLAGSFIPEDVSTAFSAMKKQLVLAIDEI